MALTIYPYPKARFTFPDEIITASDESEVSNFITNSINSFHDIDVNEASKNMRQVGQLLQLAYAASIGQTCNRPIVGILKNYLVIMGDTTVVSKGFVRASLTALQAHTKALQLLEADKPTHAIKVLAGCAKHAQQMVQESQELVVKLKQLSDHAEAALNTAVDDRTLSVREKKAVVEKINNFKAKEAEEKKKSSVYAEAVREAEQQAQISWKEMRNANLKALIVNCVSALASPVIAVAKLTHVVTKNDSKNEQYDAKGNLESVLNEQKEHQATLDLLKMNLAGMKERLKHIEEKDKPEVLEEIAKIESHIGISTEHIKALNERKNVVEAHFLNEAALAKNKAMLAEKKASDLRQEKIESLCSMAEAVAKITALGSEENYLSQAVHSLELAISALAKVNRTFENTKVFWVNIQSQCESLAGVENFEEIGDLKEFLIEEIKYSGLNWLALGRINYLANKMIVDCYKSVGDVMSDLPTSQRAITLIPELAKTLLNDCEQEKKNLVPKIETAANA